MNLYTYRRDFFFLISCVFFLRIWILFQYSDQLEGSITPDSREYLWLAQNFSDSYSLTDSSNPYLSFRRTPIYPLFLSLFSEGKGLFASLVAQQVLSMGIVYLTWLLSKKLFSEKIAWIAGLLTSIETSLLTSSFMILSETLFTFLFLSGIYAFIYSQYCHFQKICYVFSGVFFGLSALTRPIGIAIAVILVLYLLLTHGKMRLRTLITLSVMVVFIICWSIRSLLSFGIFEVSSIQAHNLHLFEGSGARAYRLGIPLDDVHTIEANLMSSAIGEEFTLADEQKYRNARGLTLILENFPWFIQMHLVGATKLLIGPGQGDSLGFLTSGQIYTAAEVWHFILVGFLLTLTSFILVMALVGILRSEKSSQFLLILISLLVVVSISSGIQAYARFRAPIAPLLCVFAAIGIDKLLNKRVPTDRSRP